MIRPFCFLSAAISIDGKIATANTNDSKLSSFEDWKRVHRLRNSVDAIMVGRNTIMVDNPKLVVKAEFLSSREELKNPIRVVPDSSASISPSANVIVHSPEVPTIVAVSENAPSIKIKAIEEAGAEIFVSGKNRVDLRKLMTFLFEKKKCKKLMLEGGGKLNWGMLQLELIDELRLAIAPTIIGGYDSIPLFGGTGYRSTVQSPLLILKSKELLGDCLVLTFKVDTTKHRQLNI